MDWLKTKTTQVLDYFWNNLTQFLIFMFVLAMIILTVSYYTDNIKLAAILKDTGTVIIAGAVFQFILKSRGFVKVVDETLDHTKRQWEKYNFQYINKLLRTIKEAHSSFEYDFNQTKFESIEKARNDYIEMTNKAKTITKDVPRTADEEELLRRNFYIREISNIRTIYKNGCEIVTIEADIEIIRDGLFVFKYTTTSSNKDTKMPDFQTYIDNIEKRFFDYSFSAKVLDLPDNLINTKLEYEAIVDTESEKNIVMSLPNTLLKGDTFKLLFSITNKDEYTKEKLANGDLVTPSSSSKYPIGVRHYTIQEEHYGNTAEDDEYLLSPHIKDVKGNDIECDSKSAENLFYKVHKWTLYYSKIQDGKIKLDLI